MGIKKHELHGQINEMPSIQSGLYSEQENNPKEKSKDHICTTASIGTNWCDYLHACKKGLDLVLMCVVNWFNVKFHGSHNQGVWNNSMSIKIKP